LKPPRVPKIAASTLGFERRDPNFCGELEGMRKCMLF
jgi:hypothetical protein